MSPNGGGKVFCVPLSKYHFLKISHLLQSWVVCSTYSIHAEEQHFHQEHPPSNLNSPSDWGKTPKKHPQSQRPKTPSLNLHCLPQTNSPYSFRYPKTPKPPRKTNFSPIPFFFFKKQSKIAQQHLRQASTIHVKAGVLFACRFRNQGTCAIIFEEPSDGEGRAAVWLTRPPREWEGRVVGLVLEWSEVWWSEVNSREVWKKVPRGKGLGLCTWNNTSSKRIN